MNYDPYDQAEYDNEFAVYADLQRSCPVHRHVRANPPVAPYPYGAGGTAYPTTEFFSVTRYRDVLAALQDADRFQSHAGPVADYLEFADGGMLVYADRPHHTGQRRIVNKAFLPRRVAGLRPRVEALANELIDSIAPKGACDLVAEFAAVLPMQVIAELVGIPEHDRETFRSWSDATVAGFDANDDAAVSRAERAFRDYTEYVLGMIQFRRSRVEQGSPVPDDLVTVLIEADYEGRRFSDEEVVRCVQQLVVAGNETTRAAIAFGVELLCRHPSQRARLEHDAALVEGAVEEILRHQPPIRGLFRTTAAATEISGCPVPADAKVRLMFAAANRDPDEWDDPHEFRIDRELSPTRRHLSFGSGVHACVGAPLARLELHIAIPLLFARLPNLRLDPDHPGEPQRNLLHRGWEELPVAWDTPTPGFVVGKEGSSAGFGR